MCLEQILRCHSARYPLMQPIDAVKLIYQNEFGGGHLVTDENACLARLRAEYEVTPQGTDIPLTEELGNGLVRVMLGALDAHGYTVEELGQDFIRSANAHRGTPESFLKKLEILRTVTKAGCFRFSDTELEAYLTGYIQAGCPMVSHSAQYREAYRPAYRVVQQALLP